MLVAAPQDRALCLWLLNGAGAGGLTPVAELCPPGSSTAFSFPAAPVEDLAGSSGAPSPLRMQRLMAQHHSSAHQRQPAATAL